MVNKTLATCREQVSRRFPGATILLGGFGDPGLPGQMLEALREQGAKDGNMVSQRFRRRMYALAVYSRWASAKADCFVSV